MVFTSVVAFDGERWDGLAARAYGDAMLIGKIIDANPDIGMWERLEGGWVVTVPVIDGQPAVSDSSLLPPWKR